MKNYSKSKEGKDIILPRTADIVIIGSGAMGLACAYYLRKLGIKNIMILEQDHYAGGHSTSRCAGGFRHQFGTRMHIRLSKLNMKLWNEFALENSFKLGFDNTGYMFVLEKSDNINYFKESISLQNEERIQSRWIEADEVKQRLPFLEKKEIAGASYCHQDGLIDAGALINEYIAACKREGIQIVTNTKVNDLKVHNKRVCTVSTTQGEIHAGIVINAAGPWAGNICDMIGKSTPVFPVKQQLFVTEKILFLDKSLPVIVFPDTGLGIHLEGESLLSGLHREGLQTEVKVNGLDVEWEMRHCKQLLLYLPELKKMKIQSSWYGYYDCTPDGNPMIGEMPEIEGLFCIFGFNGHGFMHSAACGLLLAELIFYGKTRTLQIQPFSLARFFDTDSASKELYKI